MGVLSERWPWDRSGDCPDSLAIGHRLIRLRRLRRLYVNGKSRVDCRAYDGPAKSYANPGVVDLRGEAVGPGKPFDGSHAFRSFPFLCRPDAFQLVLEHDAVFSSAQSLVNMLIEGVHQWDQSSK